MVSRLQIRRLSESDLPFADAVRAAVGWNQTLIDWQRLLDHDPEGCFLAVWEGEPAGTVTTTMYGSELAWIGMLLVHPRFRRHGIGRGLLQHSLEYLRGRGVQCIKLDATPQGQPLYEQIGFACEWTIKRCERRGTPANVAPTKSAAHAIPTDYAAIHRLEAEGFGVSRRRWLDGVLRDCRRVVVSDTDGRVGGFGILREGARAMYLGPLAAHSASEARNIIGNLLCECRESQLIFWDVPQPNQEAVRIASELGFAEQRPLARMFLGPNVSGRVARVFGIGGPEVG